MTLHRPPIGGLFRVSAPRSAANAEAGADAHAEAREAIRAFMTVLEKLDRQVAAQGAPASTPRAPRRRAVRTQSNPAESRA